MNTKIVALCFAVALAGCLDVDQTDDSDVTSTAKIASNAMLPTVIQPTGIYAAALTGQALTNSGLEGTTGGRSYLSYIIDCALPAGRSITSTYGLTKYTYPGSIGIAPLWTSRALTSTEIGYLSSCVLARANQFGQPVTISMRGGAAALATTSDELANYNVEEGAFYGNIFWTGLGAGLHACNGVDQVRDGDTYGDLPLRQCAQPDPNNPGYTPCGFIFDGNCSDVCSFDTDHYTQCGNWSTIITTRLYGTAP